MNMTAIIKELSETDGASGFEREVRIKMEQLLAPISDEIVTDRIGSIFGVKTGEIGGPRVLLAGHLDEVGFIITHITKDGFLRFDQLGGWWTHTIVAQRVKIKTGKGDIIGIVGSKPPHVLPVEERTKVVPMKDLFIDVGATSQEDVEKMGIGIGDSVVPVSEFFTMRSDELWAGKALDNCVGCAISLAVLERLQTQPHPNVVYAGATVQEEVGLRGAITSANLVQPDVAIAVDVAVAQDTPGLEGLHGVSNVGGGPLVMVFDSHMIAHVGLRRLTEETARELGIKVQVLAQAGGGTDAGKFHLNGIGCPSISISFATRYIHSHTAILSKKDFEDAVNLITALIVKLDRQTIESLR